MPHGDLSAFTKGAQLERQIRTLKPGRRIRISREMLADIIVPANPLDRQTPEYLANWFHSRMPFYCTLYQNPIHGFFEIDRPSE